MFLPQLYKNKKVLVMGLGLHGGGMETVRFLVRHGAHVCATDTRSQAELKKSLDALRGIPRVTYILGRHRMCDIRSADLIVKNPGVPLNSPYLEEARRSHIPITTDMGIFFRACPAPIIGVTGTRGKSTTAFLCAEFLRTTGKKVFLGGNIRTSVFTFLHKVRKEDFVVLELSSFQLEDLASEKISPSYAIFTNLMRDHLNRHGTMARYSAAKSVIFKFQKPGDYLFVGRNDVVTRALARHAPHGVHVSFPTLPQIFQKVVHIRFGVHYKNSVALAIALAKHFKVSSKTILHILHHFRALEGRQEVISLNKKITLVNDTTATTPDAAIAALQRFSGKNSMFIIGGTDKKLEFQGLAQEIRARVAPQNLFLLNGSATEKLIRALTKIKFFHKYPPQLFEDLKILLRGAKERIAVLPRATIVFSPGAASFEKFKNEFDRGEKFTVYSKQIF